jgi:hypothetical protein
MSKILTFIPDETCWTNERIASPIVYVSSTVALVIAAVMMRKVHDAFFLKNEFKWLAAFGFPLAVIAFVLATISSTAKWAPLANFAFYLTNTITSFVIPSIISIKHNQKMSSSSPTTSTGTDNDDSATAKPAKSIDLLKNKAAMKYIEEFLAHYQMLRQSKNLLFYFDLVKFKATDNDLARTTKAYLLFNKYLEKGAYIQIDLTISEQELESLRSTITKAVKKYDTMEVSNGDVNDDSSLPEDIFDSIFKQLKKEIKDKIIRPFVASEFYEQYLASIRLSQGLKEVESV